MSGAAPNKLYSVNSGAVSLSGGATKSLWLLDPVTAPFSIVEFGVSFNASVSTVPVEVDLYIAASVGSAAGTSASVYALGSTTVSATTTALSSLSTEPSTKYLVQSWYVQPFGGILDIQYPLGREGMSAIGGSTTTDRIGLQVTTPSGVAPSAISYVWFEE
jgi:hypothetical protein